MTVHEEILEYITNKIKEECPNYTKVIRTYELTGILSDHHGFCTDIIVNFKPFRISVYDDNDMIVLFYYHENVLEISIAEPDSIDLVAKTAINLAYMSTYAERD